MHIIQILLLIVLFIALRLTWKRANEQVIRRREALLWTMLWLGAALVVLWPDLTTRIAEVVGVGRGADLAVYGSVILLFILIFRLHVALDKLERTITKLVRREALRDLERGTETSQRSPAPEDRI